MIKRMFLAAITLLLLFTSSVFAFTKAQLHSPAGYWLTIDDKTDKPRGIVRLFLVKTKEGKEVRGTLYAPIYQLGKVERQHCTGCIAPWTNKPMQGLQFLWGFTQEDKDWDSPWLNGKIFDVDSNKDIYRGKLWLDDGGKELHVRGYLLFFYRTQTWQRISEKTALAYQQKATDYLKSQSKKKLSS